MSVQSEIDRIITAVGNAYSKVSEKDGTVPASQTVANLATAIGSIPAGGGGAGFSVTFPATAAEWTVVDRKAAHILLADGTLKSVEDYSTIGGKTIENVAGILIKGSASIFVLRMTLSEGRIAQCGVASNSLYVTTAPNTTPTPYNFGRDMIWWPVADTVISAIEMYNTD